jgi:tetratricopeptide (TPR) repeat protein
MPGHAVTLNPPRDEQVFEDLCLDLFSALWDGAQLYGRRGHEQKGIDLYGKDGDDPVAVQCKKREGKLSKADVEKDVQSVRKHDPPFKKLIFATTARRDPKLQDFVRGLKEPFAVEVWFWDDLEREIARHDTVYRFWEPVLGAAPPLVDVERLPSTILARLIGRETEMEMLEDAWRDPAMHVLTLVAVGGAGKTALVHHWMQRFEAAGWKTKGAAAAFAWSFYSQGGGEDRQASGDAFIDAALRFFGEHDPPATPRDRGLRLAELVRRRRTLLILDGLEPLQEPPASAQGGKVKDPAVAALIRALAADNPGLLVLTTREPVADLASREGQSVHSHDLDQLSPAAGAALLRWLGVAGKAGALEALSTEMHGHAFTLTLLGTYLRDAHQGDVRAWKDLDLLEAAALIDNQKAARVMAAYAGWFGEGPERQILALLGLFDRPADAAAVTALRQEPAIPGLTDQLMALGTPRWNVALERLRRARLLLEEEGTTAADALDAHPLVREHFGKVLERDAPAAWRAGHERLYRHYAAATDDLPDTLPAMQPLYLAIGHGCRAGQRQEVCDEVYWRRVQRGREGFSVHKLGAFGADLTALAGFFEQPWDRPARELRPGDQAWLLNTAGFYLRALGRLVEAIEPMEAGLQMAVDAEQWKNGAIAARNLSELTLTVGQLHRALDHARTAVELADRSGDRFQRIVNRTTLGEALHATGEVAEAEAAFREAEALQAELQPPYPKLYSLQGYRYCDLLLSRAAPLDGSALGRDGLGAVDEEARRRCEAVRERALYARKIAEKNRWLLDIALDHLSLGRATLGLALATGGDLNPATEPLNAAVQGLRAAGQEDHLPRGLIARATLHRFGEDEAAAEADLSEALEIAERGSMKLHECNAHLEWARLRRSVGDPDGAREHLERARALVAETGYHRRDREVAALTAGLA